MGRSEGERPWLAALQSSCPTLPRMGKVPNVQGACRQLGYHCHQVSPALVPPGSTLQGELEQARAGDSRKNCCDLPSLGSSSGLTLSTASSCLCCSVSEMGGFKRKERSSGGAAFNQCP